MTLTPDVDVLVTALRPDAEDLADRAETHRRTEQVVLRPGG